MFAQNTTDYLLKSTVADTFHTKLFFFITTQKCRNFDKGWIYSALQKQAYLMKVCILWCHGQNVQRILLQIYVINQLKVEPICKEKLCMRFPILIN